MAILSFLAITFAQTEDANRRVSAYVDFWRMNIRDAVERRQYLGDFISSHARWIDPRTLTPILDDDKVFFHDARHVLGPGMDISVAISLRLDIHRRIVSGAVTHPGKGGIAF